MYLQRRTEKLEKQVLKPRGHGDTEERRTLSPLLLWLQEILCIAARERPSSLRWEDRQHLGVSAAVSPLTLPLNHGGGRQALQTPLVQAPRQRGDHIRELLLFITSFPARLSLLEPFWYDGACTINQGCQALEHLLFLPPPPRALTRRAPACTQGFGRRAAHRGN